MKLLMDKRFIVLLVIILINCMTIAQGQYLWRQISGNWEILEETNQLIEKQGKTISWGYSELINNNSIETINELGAFTNATFNIEFNAPVHDQGFFLFFWGMLKQMEFSAIRFSAEGNKIRSIEYIESEFINKAIKGLSKWNFSVTVIESREVEMLPNRKYKCDLLFKNNNVSVLIDNKKVLSCTLRKNVTLGKVGFSNRNLIPAINEIKITDARKIIFQDHFINDSIKRIGVSGQIQKKQK